MLGTKVAVILGSLIHVGCQGRRGGALGSWWWSPVHAFQIPMETNVYAILRAYQWCSLLHLLTPIYPENSDHWNNSHMLCGNNKQYRLGDTVNRTLCSKPKKKSCASFVYERVGKNHIIKISRCDLFTSGYVSKLFWGGSPLWNVWHKFLPASGESCEQTPSLFLRSTTVIRIISPSPACELVGVLEAELRSLLSIPRLQDFSVSWTAFYLFFLSPLHNDFSYLLALIDASVWECVQNPSVHCFLVSVQCRSSDTNLFVLKVRLHGYRFVESRKLMDLRMYSGDT